MTPHEEALRFAEQPERAAKENQVAMERVNKMFEEYLSKLKERKDGRSI